MRTTMEPKGRGGHAAVIPFSASAVFPGVAVQDFLPVTTLGHSHPEITPWHGREIEYGNGCLRVCFIPPNPTDGALFRIIAIDPLEAARVRIAFMEGRLSAVGAIQVLDPFLN